MDKKIEKKQWTFKKLGLYVLALGSIAFFFSAIYRDVGVSRLNVDTERLLIDTIQKDNFQEFIPISGVVQPIKTVFLDAIEGGRVDKILVEDGAVVKKGQAIIQLSNSDLQLSYLNQEAQIVSQINNVRNTSILMDQQSLSLKEQALDVEYRIDQIEKQLARSKSLYQDGVIAQVEFEEAVDEYEHLLRRRKLLKQTVQKDSTFQEFQNEQMNATLDLMNRNLTIAKSSLENLIITAPIDGQLSSMNTELGELITKGEKIAQIDVLSNFKVRARIDEFYISRIFIEQEGTVVLSDKKYPLRIRKIYPDVRNGAFEVDLVFTKEIPESIKRGQSLSIKLSLSSETEALLLARGSFYQKTGGNWIYIIDPTTNKAFKKEIKIGRQNPSYFEVLQGLKEGDIVITSSYDSYNDKDELVLQ